MAGTTKSARERVEEMVKDNDIVRVHLNPALTYGKPGTGNDNPTPIILGAPRPSAMDALRLARCSCAARPG